MEQTLIQGASQDFNSVFRTEAWVQAWIDTWGTNSAIKLIDLGGRKHPLEYVYTGRSLLKKALPLRHLTLAGVSSSAISSPRSEYNHAAELISLHGSVKEFSASISRLTWQQCKLPDLISDSANAVALRCVANEIGALCYLEKKEPAYFVMSQGFEPYLKGLGSSTRLAYFNRREKLALQGVIELKNFSVSESSTFFELLNKFHLLRWGRPCYSRESQQFMSNFMERLAAEGGEVVMQALLISGEVVSVIVDVVWQGRRYNLQSGYYENKFHKVALGALHLGYAIEHAINNQQAYDFLAGSGKQSNYKAKIATHQLYIESVSLLRAHAKYARKIYDFVYSK